MPGLAFLLAFGLLSYAALQNVAGRAAAVEQAFRRHDALMELQLAVEQAIMPPNDYLVTGDPAEQDRFVTLSAGVEARFAAVEALIGDTEQGRALLADTRAEWRQARILAEAILALPNPVGDAEGARLMEQMDALAHELIGDLATLHQQDEMRAGAAEAAAQTTRRQAGVLLLLGTAVILAGGLVFGWYFSNVLARPLTGLTRTAEALGQGDLTARAAVEGDDEVARLGRAFNAMADALQCRLAELHALAEASQTITAELDLTTTLEQIVETALDVLEADRGALYLLDRATDTLSCACAIGFSAEYVEAVSRRYRELPGHRVLSDPTPVVVLDAQTDPRLVSFREAVLREGYHSFAVLPLVAKDQIIGVLAVYRDQVRAFDDNTLWLARSFAGQAAIALARAREHQAVKDTEERYRAVVQSATDAIISADSRGKIVFWNQAAQAMFGYEEDEVLGRSLTLLLPERYREAHQRGLERLRTAGEPQIVGKTVEFHGLRKDGREFPLELSLSIWQAGGEEFYTAIVRDITERVQAEEQLHLQVAALEAAANGIVITDRQGTIRWVNPAFTRLTGYAAEEAIGQNPRILKSGVHDDALYQNLWDTITAGQVWQGEMINRRKDGRLYTEEQTITPVRDASGETTHFIAIKQDITARKRAEKALQQSLSELQHLQTVTQALLELEALPQVMSKVAQGIVTNLGYDMALVTRYVEAQNGFTGLARYPTPSIEQLDQILVHMEHVNQEKDLRESRIPYQPGANSTVDRVLDGEVVISDSLADFLQPWVPCSVAEAAQKRSGMQTYISLPMRVKGQTVGTILAGVQRECIAADQQQALVRVADQGAVAIENARLFTETREALAHEQRLNEIARTISSTLDPPTVLTTVVRLAAELVGADAGALALVEPDGQTITYPYLFNLPEELNLQPSPEGAGLAWHIVKSGESVRLDDYGSHPDALSRWVEAGVHGFIGVPVTVGETSIGGLGLFSLTPEKRFSKRDLALAESVGWQAGVVIENARLYEETRRRVEQLATINAVGRAFAETLDLEQIYERFCRAVYQLLPDISTVVISLYDAEREQIICAHGLHDGERIAADELPPIPLEASGVGTQSEAIRTRRPIIANKLWERIERVKTKVVVGASEPATQSALFVPMLARDAVIGVLQVQSYTPDRFRQDDADMLALVANAAAIAVQNARLFAAEQSRRQELAALYSMSRQLVATDELAEVLDTVARHAVESVHVTFCRILTLEKGSVQTEQMSYGFALDTFAHR